MKKKHLLLLLNLLAFAGCDQGQRNYNAGNKTTDTASAHSEPPARIPTDSDYAKISSDPHAGRDTASLKAAKDRNIATVNDVTLKFQSISPSKQWPHDDYGTKYLCNEAERGDVIVVAHVAVSAESKNPQLPPISVFIISNGTLRYIGDMAYRFSKWENYGSFLGNYADYGNDFAHTKTVPFTCGLEIADTDMKSVIVVAVKKENCYEQSYDRFGDPPVSYHRTFSEKGPATIDYLKANYIIVKIFNRNKLL